MEEKTFEETAALEKEAENVYTKILKALRKGQNDWKRKKNWQNAAAQVMYHLLELICIKIELNYAETADKAAEQKLSLEDFPYIKEKGYLYDSLSLLFEFLRPVTSAETIRKYNYYSIVTVAELISYQAYDGWRSMYQRFMKHLFELNTGFIKGKEKIKVAFFVPSATYFSCESIYRKFEADSRYEPYLVLICHYQDLDKKMKEESVKFFRDMCDYFKDKDYKYIIAHDGNGGNALGYEEIGSPDIIFNTYPYTDRYFEEKLSLTGIPITALNTYIPYGVQVLNFAERVYNMEIHEIAFKIYYETYLHKDEAAAHAFMGTSNVVVSGYVKMDASYEQFLVLKQGEGFIWKNAGKALYRIIYAPHHSLTNAMTSSGTFHLNSEFFYNLAKATPQVSWVIKPHPNLRVRSVAWGLYKSVEEYDAYMNRWNELPNAMTVQDRPYQDIFASSDAMIFDSISFMTEYIYYHKPSLFLTRDTNDFNKLGKMILSVLYTADGRDAKAAAEFLKDVVFGGNDYKKEEREKFFSEYLDYKTINEKLAAETIYDDINSYFA